jgi:hypothetical protein
MVVGLTVGLSIFLVLLAASLITLHRVFRRRRLGARAESPPPSPLMSMTSSTSFPGGEGFGSSAGSIMGGRMKAGGMVLPKDF